MELAVRFGSLSDAEKRELAGMLLEQAHEKGLAVRLPERTQPYTVADAATALNVSKGTVYNLIEASRLKTITGLSVKMITAESLHAVRAGKELAS